MSKTERAFYIFIILAEFVLVLLFYTRLNNTMKNRQVELLNSPKQENRMFSFYGITGTKEKYLVHFTPYSTDYYIFVSVSNECNHCKKLLESIQDYFVDKKIADNIKIILVSQEDPVQTGLCPVPGIRCLKLTFEDIFQFGDYTPSIFVTDGKGNILYKYKGYADGIFQEALKKLSPFIQK
jgi:hypothetical protein